jgi:hypothetical protein
MNNLLVESYGVGWHTVVCYGAPEWFRFPPNSKIQIPSTSAEPKNISKAKGISTVDGISKVESISRIEGYLTLSLGGDLGKPLSLARLAPFPHSWIRFTRIWVTARVAVQYSVHSLGLRAL